MMMFSVPSEGFYFSRLFSTSSDDKLPLQTLVLVGSQEVWCLSTPAVLQLQEASCTFQGCSWFPCSQFQAGRPFFVSIYSRHLSFAQKYSLSNQATFMFAHTTFREELGAKLFPAVSPISPVTSY